MRAKLAEIRGAEADEPEAVDDETTTVSDDKPEVDDARLRGPDGKFISKNAATEEAPAQPVSAPAQGSGTAPPAIDTPIPEPVETPAHWPAEHKAMFAKLPPEGRTFLLEREREITADYTRKTQAIKPLADLDAHFGPVYARQGVSTAQAAASLLDTHVKLLQGTPDTRRQIFAELHRQFGVDFSTPPGEQAQVDPVTQAAQALQSMFAPRLQSIEERLTAEQDSRNLSTVQSFAQTKSADGSPMYPHFDAVTPDMTRIMQAGLVPMGDLKAAYEMAVWSNPTTRAAMQKAAAPKPVPTNGKLPVAAKKAAAVTNMPKSAPGQKGNSVKGDTIDQTMRNRLAELRGSEA